jgi:hypothetical protein
MATTTKTAARAALDAMLAQGDIEQQTKTIAGLGDVTIENCMGQRYAFLDNVAVSIAQLRRLADDARVEPINEVKP